MFNMNRLSYRKPLAESALTLRESFITSDHMNHSYFAEACAFTTTMDNWMVLMERSMYQGICESEGSQVLINESVSEWFETFKNLLKKVVDFLHALLNKFLVGLNMFLSREKFIKDHKKDFNKFNDNHKFHMNVFNFTLDNDIPLAGPIYSSAKLNDVFRWSGDTKTGNWIDDSHMGRTGSNEWIEDDPTTGVHTVKADKGTDDAFAARYTELKDAMDNGDIYDKIRGMMLGLPAGTRVDATDYSKDLFEVFRDGQSGKEEHEFEYSDIQDALLRFDRYEHCKKALTKQKKDAEKEYKEVIKALDHYAKAGKDGNLTVTDNGDTRLYKFGTETAANKYALIVRALSSMVHEVSNIHTIGFSAKLDAYKDCFKQDKSILYKALYRILGNIRTGERKYSTPREGD